MTFPEKLQFFESHASYLIFHYHFLKRSMTTVFHYFQFANDLSLLTLSYCQLMNLILSHSCYSIKRFNSAPFLGYFASSSSRLSIQKVILIFLLDLDSFQMHVSYLIYHQVSLSPVMVSINSCFRESYVLPFRFPLVFSGWFGIPVCLVWQFHVGYLLD